MIDDIRMDELMGKVDSRYGLAVAVARRARQINEYTATLGLNDGVGIPGPQVHTRSQNPITIALEELRAGKLHVTFKVGREQKEESSGGPSEESAALQEEEVGGIPQESGEISVHEEEGGEDDEGQSIA